MTMSDPIADMLTRIRNAYTEKHDTVDVPSSKMKLAIADILVREGYIKKYDIVEDGGFQTIRIELKYGKDKNTWNNNVENYILLKSNEEYFTDPVCKNGYFRGIETYKFVRDINSRYESYKKKIKS